MMRRKNSMSFSGLSARNSKGSVWGTFAWTCGAPDVTERKTAGAGALV
jgi:hypothetical protein